MNTKKIANLNVLAIANARTVSLHHLIELLLQEGQFRNITSLITTVSDSEEFLTYF